MSGSNIRGVEKSIRIERAQAARPFDGFDRRLAGQEKQRPGSLRNRFGVIALGFERLAGQAAGFADVLIR